MKPEPYQIEASQFVYQRDQSMLFAKMGAGKTLTYLLAMQDWMESDAVRKILVVAPLRVVNNVWRQERDKWKSPLTMARITGEVREDIRYCDVVLTNYEMMPEVLESDHGCDAIVFDELSRLRNPGGVRQRAARRARFKIRSGGTGTPAPNRLTSIFGMAHAVGLGHLVGRNHDKWLRRYFYPTDFEQHNWAAFADTPDELAALIKPYTYVLEDSAITLPPIVRVPMPVELPAELRVTYDELRKTSQLSDHEIVAGSAGVLFGKLRQVASGFIYDHDHNAIGFDPYRFELIKEIVDEAQGQPLIIAYEFVEQLRMMQEEWPGLPFIGGGSKNDDQTIESWNLGKLPLLGLHPAAAGHGLNLQTGGNAVAWWQLPTDLELYDQLLARLARRGQVDDRVFSYEPAALNTIDMIVIEQAHAKREIQEGLWAALRR
jgi:SNF2 family DNA or RNA helicase